VAGVYVASVSLSGSQPFRLERFDPNTLSLLDYIDQRASPALAEKNLWAQGTAGDLGKIYRLDPNDVTNSLATVSIGGANSVSRLHGTNDRLYLTELSGATSNDRTDRLDPNDGSVIWSVNGTVCGPNPSRVVDDGTYAYVVNAEFTARSVTKLDAADGSFVDDVQLGNEPFDLALVGTDLYVLRGAPNAMDRIDTATMTVTTAGVVTGSFGGIATDDVDVFLSRGGVSNEAGVRFDVDSQTIVETATVGSGQAGLNAYLDVDFYTTGYSGSTGNVTRFSRGPLASQATTTLFGYPQAIAVMYANPGLSGIFVGAVVF
jgi:hypothetical protein